MSNKTKTIELLNTNLSKEVFNENGLYAICYNNVRIYTIYIYNNEIELHIDNKQLVKALESYFDKEFSLIHTNNIQISAYYFVCDFRNYFKNFLTTVSIYLLNI